MRVLIVDQDSASNLAITRSLRESYSVDAVTTKAACLDLLRANTFEVIVATERLEDGSGLELLGQVAQRWPSMQRIFCAERERLKLLKGRLGPFNLFQTLSYPIDPERLLSVLSLADTAHESPSHTDEIAHVELEGATASGAPASESAAPPEPRAASGSQDIPEVSRGFARAATAARARRSSSAPRPGSLPGRSPPAPRLASATTPVTASPARHGRSRSAAPVRFPPLESVRPPAPSPAGPQPTPSRFSKAENALAEAADLARQARANRDSPVDEFDSKRLIRIASVVAIVIGVLIVGYKLFGARGEPAAASVHAPAPAQPAEVTALVSQIENALTSDDIKGARTAVDKLQQLAPRHPRLEFFQKLLAHREATAAAQAANGQVAETPHKSRAGKHAAASGSAAAKKPSSAVPHGSQERSSSSETVGAEHVATPKTVSDTAANAGPSATSTGVASTLATAVGSIPAAGASTPATGGTSIPAAAVTATAGTSTVGTAGTSTPAAAGASTPGTQPPAAAGPQSPSVAAAVTAATAPAPAPRKSASDEPPPVIREAKLIRLVPADYPSAARKADIEGSVDLNVTVSSEGAVTDVTVAHATPPDIFDKAAIAAVRRYKYDPRFVDGLPAEAHLKVHLDFKPEK